MYVDSDELSKALRKLNRDALGKMEAAISGRDCEHGELEALSAGLARAHEVITKLIFVMLANQILTRQEAVAIVAEYCFEKYLCEEDKE